MIINLDKKHRIHAKLLGEVNGRVIAVVRIEEAGTGYSPPPWIMARVDGEFEMIIHSEEDRFMELLYEVTRRFPEFVLSALIDPEKVLIH